MEAALCYELWSFAVLSVILPIGVSSASCGADEQEVHESAVKPPTISQYPEAVASRGNVAGTGEFRFKSLGLSSLRPLARGRMPVVLVQGFWGSPRLWEPMVKTLEADPCVGGRFQFLTFAYQAGNSIPHSALLLRQELRTLRDLLDPDRADPSWDRMVLIGHSMGGILCKMMAQDSSSKLWDLVTDRSFEDLAGPAEALRLLQEEMIFKPLPEVRRVIFIATPHKGSPLVREPIRIIVSMFASPDEGSQRARASLLTANGSGALRPERQKGLPTGIDQLAWGHPLLLAIDGLPIDPSIKQHSIIADRRNPPRPNGSDGQVPYASSHLAGATSELLVSGGHYCLANPDVIGEIARILKEHATDRDRPWAFPAQPIGPERCEKPRPQPKAGWGCPNSRDRAGANVPAIDPHAPGVK